MGIFLVVGLIFSVICGLVASNKHRNAVGWAACGFFFGVITLIVLVAASPLPPADAG